MTAGVDVGNDPQKGDGAAFAITVAFDLHEGAFAEFHRLVSANAAASVAQEAQCLRFDVLTPLDGSGPSVLLYEIYADRAAFDRHLTAEHYLTFDAGTRHLVRKKTVMTFAVAENAKEPVAT